MKKTFAGLLVALFVCTAQMAYAQPAEPFVQRWTESDSNNTIGGVDANNTLFGVVVPTASALSANGANCSSGSAPLGTDAAGAAEGCFDVETDAEASSHEGNASAHHTATVDTNANTICTGTGNYLDGEGNCDALVTDTGAPHGDGANCSAGSAPLGVDAAGAVQSCFDVETDAEASSHEGNASAHHTATVDTNANTICSGTDVFLDGEGNCDTLSTGAHTTSASDLTSGSLADARLPWFEGQFTQANLRTATPSATGVLAINTTDFDLYTSTGTGEGDWRNTRTGTGP